MTRRIQRFLIYHTGLIPDAGNISETTSLIGQMQYILYYSNRQRGDIVQSDAVLKFAGLCRALNYLPESLMQIGRSNEGDFQRRDTDMNNRSMKVHLTNSVLVFFSLEEEVCGLTVVVEVSRSQAQADKNDLTVTIIESIQKAHHSFQSQYDYSILEVTKVGTNRICDQMNINAEITRVVTSEAFHQLKIDLKSFYDKFIDDINQDTVGS